MRPKPIQKEPQPLVTQHMLEATRAKLGRNRPVAASTPKQQLSELEKYGLQVFFSYMFIENVIYLSIVSIENSFYLVWLDIMAVY